MHRSITRDELAGPGLPILDPERPLSREAASIFEEPIASGRVDELADQRQANGLKAGLEIPAKDYLKAMRSRTLVHYAYQNLFGTVAILVVPSRYTMATKNTTRSTEPRRLRIVRRECPA